MHGWMNWWRFAVGLLGGRTILGAALTLVPASAGYLIWLAANEVPLQSSHYATATAAALLATMAWFGAVIGWLMLWRYVRENPLAKLVPGLDRQVRRLSWHVLGYSAIMLPITLLLRGFALARYKFAPGELMSFMASDWGDHALQLGWLAYVTVLLIVSVRFARLPLRYSGLTVYWGAAPWSSPAFMFKIAVALLVLLAAWWLGYGWTEWQRRRGNQQFQSAPELPGFERLRAWRLRRAATAAHGGGSRRFVALISTRETLLYGGFAIMFTALQLMLMGSSSMLSLPSFWMLAMTAAVLAVPQPLPVARLLLLPCTASRGTLHNDVLRAWLAIAMRRVIAAMAFWFLLNTLFWLIDWRPFDMARLLGDRPPPVVELLWRPLAHGVAIAGTTAAVCLLLAAVPHLLTRSAWLMPLNAAAAAAVAALAYLVWRPLAAGDSGWLDPARLWSYALATGIVTPVLAAAINRAFAICWRHANVAKISSAMAQFAERLESLRPRAR